MCFKRGVIFGEEFMHMALTAGCEKHLWQVAGQVAVCGSCAAKHGVWGPSRPLAPVGQATVEAGAAVGGSPCSVKVSTSSTSPRRLVEVCVLRVVLFKVAFMQHRSLLSSRRTALMSLKK